MAGGMTDTGTTQDLAARVAMTTTRLARMLRQQDEGELTLTQRAALATIERHGTMTLGELGHVEHIAPPTVTKVVGQLTDRGLVERLADEDDRRVCRVAITEVGADLLAADRRRRTAWIASRLDELPDRSRVQLHAAIAILESLLEGEPAAVGRP